MTAPDPRAELIADLRAFADLLERRPDMPIDHRTMVSVFYGIQGADDAARLAEAERVADLLGVEPDRSATSAAARLTSGRVEYVAYASTVRGQAEWVALTSYMGAVEPETAGAR